MSVNKEDNDMNSNSMYSLITHIVEAVVNSYFYWVDNYAFKQDLMQEGYLKAYELLKTGNYDPNQNLHNYLFTGVRNAMTNLNYHNNKEKHSSYDVYDDNIQDDCVSFSFTSHTYTDYSIDVDQIVKSCEKFNANYVGNVINYFRSIGFDCDTNIQPVEEPNNLLLKAIIVDIIWSI